MKDVPVGILGRTSAPPYQSEQSKPIIHCDFRNNWNPFVSTIKGERRENGSSDVFVRNSVPVVSVIRVGPVAITSLAWRF